MAVPKLKHHLWENKRECQNFADPEKTKKLRNSATRGSKKHRVDLLHKV